MIEVLNVIWNYFLEQKCLNLYKNNDFVDITDTFHIRNQFYLAFTSCDAHLYPGYKSAMVVIAVTYPGY